MIPRPLASEADSYFFTYINQVEGEDPVGTMERQLNESLELFAGITEEASLNRYAPGKWSIREALSHVTDTERAFAFRVLWFGRGFEPSLPGFDQNIAAAGARADTIPWAAHMEEFRLVRLATLALFRSLPPEGWRRGGIASEKVFTVRGLAYIIPGHTAHHVRILRERYLAPNT